MNAKAIGQIQKFHIGNIVKIADDLGSSMSHFESGCYAIVVGSYAELYGGDNVKSYSLKLLPSGRYVSWYKEHQLSLVSINKEYLSDEDVFKLKPIMDIEK